MTTEEKILKLIDDYKKAFTAQHWEDERYKWQAVKHFQDNWEENPESFCDMFMRATEKHENLLQVGSFWGPRGMINGFCEACGEEVVAYQFNKLYDEEISIRDRVTYFISEFKQEYMIDKLNLFFNKNYKTNQDTRAVSVYLAFRYPEKYYFYMEKLYFVLRDLFEFKQPIGFSDIDKLFKYYEFCDEICKYIKQDTEFIEMVSNVITDKEYNDKNFHILVQDMVFFLKNITQHTFKPNYDKECDKMEPNTWLLTWNPTRWEWEDFDEVVKLTKSGVAVPIGWTCANTHTLVGDRIYMVKLGSSSTPNGIFATGYIISDNYKDESYDPTKESKARYVDIILTDVRDFNTEPVLEMDNLKEVFPSQNWSPQASGIAIKPYISAQLLNMWNELNGCKPCSENVENKSEEYSKYSKSDFLKDVYITESEYNKLSNLLKHKKNVILQGAPGVGKTFAAKRLAYSIMGEKDDNRVQCVQFHQSYSYEDFIEGFRPLENGGFELRKGVFKDFCQKASGDNENDYFFIIDEINRGNMSKIFGELLMLIEADKRGEEHSMNLVYSNEPFFVPKNLHIIGMMNTADRSLAMIDYALRRRFSFYPMKPAFESVGFKAHTEQVNCELFHKAVEAIKNLNTVIVGDKSLGKGFEIGHSYFCTDKPENITDEIVKNIIAFEIIPTIEEYWFDNETRLDTERQKLEALLGDNNGAV